MQATTENLRKTGTIEAPSHQIRGTNYVIAETGNGGAEAYALMRLNSDNDGSPAEVAVGASIEACLSQYRQAMK